MTDSGQKSIGGKFMNSYRDTRKIERARLDTVSIVQIQFHFGGSFTTERQRYEPFQPMAIVLMRIDHTFRASCNSAILPSTFFQLESRQSSLEEILSI